MTKRERPAPYPVSLNLDGIRCLVVGGGTVAFRKMESLLASGARVTVVSPEISPDVEALEKVELLRRKFQAEDVQEIGRASCRERV